MQRAKSQPSFKTPDVNTLNEYFTNIRPAVAKKFDDQQQRILHIQRRSKMMAMFRATIDEARKIISNLKTKGSLLMME